MRTVITYGTFDLMHYGHILLLKRARALGDRLIVGLSTDEFNEQEKGKHTYISYEGRKELLSELRSVDLIIPETSWNQKAEDIKKYNADVFVMGDDWKGKFDFLSDTGVEIIYLPRTPEISSSMIKDNLTGDKL